ncbi:hypothetical protein [Guptibacillus hwajinpoensis]|uniref:N-acetyltransferase domain-containing protein n=1 Tax=Guptibacillus hwajinpoensis TaxID=208199 RepID=A0A0J6D3Q0_9BACL|nr:hypothetical protein [Alkalihalobacillus macyae]KMM38899.1 hypothetical protein AB986_06490 [Alkalihalobacillus macyae]
MIFYVYNPEFDEEVLHSLRIENPSYNRFPSEESIVYLFEEQEETIGYMWMEVNGDHVMLVDFFFKGSEGKKRGLYDFIVKLAKNQSRPFLLMKIPEFMSEDIRKKWGGKIRERDGKDLLIEIPFQK